MEINPPKEPGENKYSNAYLDQIKAAPYTLEVIHGLEQRGLLGNSLSAVRETDVFRLRRGLCLPCASASSINWVLGERVIGDSEGPLRVGDMFDTLLPHHGRREEGFDKGWLFATEEGDVYHHAIIAFANGLGLEAVSVNGFRSIRDFERLLRQGGAVAVSLDNRFVLEQTLRSNPKLVRYENDKWQIRIEGPDGLEFRNFEEGRHVVALIEIAFGRATLTDSFRLPQMGDEELIIKLPVEEVDRYLKYSKGGASRAIAFALSKEDLEYLKEITRPTAVPKRISEDITQKVRAKQRES